MEYIDPQKARQERERQERERQARIKAERERQARIKAEQERQAKLKAERERQARIKAEQEAAKKAKKAEQPELKKPVAQKPENKTPQSEKKPDPKVNSAITWSKPGETTPIQSPSALTYSSISPIHSTITPIAQLPQTELKPKAPLNRNPRTWKNEKADEPKPEPTLKERITAAKIKAISQQENDQQQKLSTILNDPKSTETQQRTAKVLSARLKASTIQQALPSDQVTLFNLLPNSQTDYRKPLFNQWLDGSKARLGPGEEKGLEQYYTDNSRTLKTLEWIINSAQKPDQPQSQRFKPYLAPTNDPKDKVELIALKNGSLKDLVNKNDPNNKNVWVNGDQIVRAITKTNAQGKPVTEFFVPKNGSEVHSLNGSSDPQHSQQQPPTEWVKITPPTEDQKIVSVDATELTQGKQPTTIKSTVNISGAEPQTHKRYNAISARYEDYTNPTFTEYQQLRGDTPRVLTGSNLRNEIGMAMFNSSLGFTPNNAPQPGTPEAELLKQGKWQGDLFNGTTLPEQYKNLPPEQQKQKQEQFKRQQETISKVEEKIKEVGGENAKVTTLPITVDVSDAKTILQLPLFRVTGKDGKDRFVDENGRLYQDMADWKANNKLPPGRVSYFADGRINDAKDQKPNIITENTHAVIDTTGERVKSVADTVLPWLGIAAGAVLIASGLGAPIGAGLIAAATVTMAGVGAYGISQGVGTLNDRATHGQSNTDLTDAEVRGTWLGLTADALSMFAVGSALRLGKGGLSLVDEVGTVGKALSIGAQYADTAAIADSTVSLAQNWDRLTPEQQLASIGQIGFWGMSTGVSARQAGGIGNLYGAKSIRDTFGGKTGGQKEGLTPTAIETVQPSSKTTQTQEPQVKSPEIIRREQELVQALPKRQQVPVEIDPSLQGNAVRVHYSVDKKGQITDIQIKAGANATPKDIELHANTVKRMQQYSGMSRHVQTLKDKWKAWRNDHGVAPVGSKAWEAQLEISKLPDIIQERVERLSNANLDPKSQQRIEAEISDLKQQLAENQRAFKMMDKDPGKGFVAAESAGSKKAKALGRPEAEEGYHWTLDNGKLRYDRDTERLPDGNARTQRAYDPSTGKFVDVDANITQPRIKPDRSETHVIPTSEQAGYENNLKGRDLARDKRDRLKALKEKDPNNFTEAQERELSRAIYEVNEHSRQIGDKGAVSYMQQKYPDAVLEYGGPGASSRPGDFDQVWRVPGKGADGGDLYIVVEAKGGSSPLGTRKVKNGAKVASQGSKEYFEDIANNMSKDKKSPEAQRVGDALIDAQESDNVRYLEIRTPIKNDHLGNGTVKDIKVNEFDISES